MYESAELEAMTPRERERLLLNRVNQKLAAAKSALGSDDPRSIAGLHEALQHNREVWNAFVLDVTHEGNKLPSELKRLLANISIFVNSISRSVVRSATASDLDSLVSINEFVMEGLGPSPSAASKSAR